MLYLKNNRVVFDAARCTQCGACLAASVCGHNALHLEERRDVFDIVIDQDACTGCRKCIRVCPCDELPQLSLEEGDFSDWRRALLAHAADAEVRFQSTSGGVARALVQAALELGWADAVYCAVQKSEPPYAEGAFLTSAHEIGRIANSVYCTFPFNCNLTKTVGGRPISRLLYIGTNCQIQAAERFFKGSGVELIKVAIICKQQKTRAYARWARRKLKQKADDPTPMRYRGLGWPGQLTSGNATYKNYFRPFAMELWRVPGCRFCPDPFGWGSEILLADPWNLVSPNSGNPGMTMTLLRTERALALWQASSAYLVEARELTAADVQKSMDWKRYRKKQAKIPYFLGREPSLLRRVGYGVVEKQRAFYEWMLDAWPVPDVVEKILNRTLPK